MLLHGIRMTLPEFLVAVGDRWTLAIVKVSLFGVINRQACLRLRDCVPICIMLADEVFICVGGRLWVRFDIVTQLQVY